MNGQPSPPCLYIFFFSENFCDIFTKMEADKELFGVFAKLSWPVEFGPRIQGFEARAEAEVVLRLCGGVSSSPQPPKPVGARPCWG